MFCFLDRDILAPMSTDAKSHARASTHTLYACERAPIVMQSHTPARTHTLYARARAQTHYAVHIVLLVNNHEHCCRVMRQREHTHYTHERAHTHTIRGRALSHTRYARTRAHIHYARARTHTHTHTPTHSRARVCVCLCVCCVRMCVHKHGTCRGAGAPRGQMRGRMR